MRIAWLHRKVMVEDFRTQYAFSTEVKFTVIEWDTFFSVKRKGLFFFFSQSSALTRAVLKTKHPQIAVKFFEDVPFELSF